MKKEALCCLTMLALALIAISSHGATNYYVWRDNPSPQAPFTNWAMAATCIQDAVDLTLHDDTVIVTNGTYDTGGVVTPSYALTNRVFVNNKRITIRSVNGPGVTIIKGKPDDATGACGDAAVRCVQLYCGVAAAGLSLSGFTLTEGYTRTNGNDYYDKSGGGIFLRGEANATVSNCVILRNMANYCGAGVQINDAGVLTNCTLTANSGAGLAGAGACLAWGGTMNNCTLNCNTGASGGGVHFYRGSPAMNGCTLSNNVALYGGGIIVNSGSPSVNYCQLVANRATYYGGGVYFFDGDGSLNNCLLIGNTSDFSHGGNVYYYRCGRINSCTVVAGGGASGVVMDGGGAMTNCIVWGNSNVDISVGSAALASNVSCTCYQTYANNKPAGAGNTTNNPFFIDTNTANYHLRNNSPCINAGTNQSWMTTATDLDGRARIDRVYGIVDMGAYEFSPQITFFHVQ